jgi:hypothetical protein
MAKKKRPYRLLILSTVNALLMLLITFHWLRLPYTFGDEAFLIKWTALTKKSLLGIDPKPVPESVLFVDISESKTTLEMPNDFGEPSPYHRMVITDRTHLTEFMAMIVPYRDQTQLVVLDVILDKASPEDSLLQEQVDLLGPKLMGVNHLEGEDQQAIPSVIDFQLQGLATYRSAQGLFLKYPLLFQDSIPTVPLVMYEQLQHQKMDHSGLFYRFPQGISLPAPVVDFKVRSNDFHEGVNLSESNFTTFKMADLLDMQSFMAEEDIAALFEHKIILIGDFSADLHETPFGKTPGLLLIYNAYLTLQEQDNIVSFFWILLIFSGYWLLSWRIFNDIELKRPRWLVRLFQTKLGELILHTLDDAFLLIVLTFISYFIFNIHINILILLVYAKVVEFIWEKVNPKLFPVTKNTMT